jgi:hypothetical protein
VLKNLNWNFRIIFYSWMWFFYTRQIRQTLNFFLLFPIFLICSSPPFVSPLFIFNLSCVSHHNYLPPYILCLLQVETTPSPCFPCSWPFPKYISVSSPTSQSQSHSQSHITTDGRSDSLSWCRARSATCDQIFFSLKAAVLSLLGALSDERSGLSFVSISL